jgi:hypothetical protein
MKGKYMVSRKTTRMLSRFFQFFAITEIVIFSGVALLVRFAGELNRATYANGLFIASAIVLVIGGMAAMSTRSRGDGLSRAIETMNPDMLKERVEHTRGMSDAAGELTMQTLLIGIVPLTASIFLAFVRL